MTKAPAQASPLDAESVQSESDGPNGRTVGIHLAALQAVWLAAIAFAIYLLAGG